MLVPALGTLGATALRYESVTHSATGQRMGKQNASVALFLSLVPSMALVPGETVTVHLTAFLGPDSVNPTPYNPNLTSPATPHPPTRNPAL